MLVLVIAAGLALAGCGGGSSSSEPAVRPTSSAVVSDEVPTLQELLDTGLSEQQAECFIETIDPDNTGRVASAELFMEAFSECV